MLRLWKEEHVDALRLEVATSARVGAPGVAPLPLAAMGSHT